MAPPKKLTPLRDRVLRVPVTDPEGEEIDRAVDRARQAGEAESFADWARRLLLAAARAEAPKPVRPRRKP